MDDGSRNDYSKQLPVLFREEKNMKRNLLMALFVSSMLLLVACGSKEVEPVAINEETDTCAFCNMAVMNNEFATQIVLESGKTLVFDDIGCMHEWVGENPDEKIAAQFVRDYGSKEWVNLEDATYVYNQSIKTPMAYNIISFQEKAAAENFVTENEGSTLLSAADLDNHSWERSSGHGSHEHSDSEEGMEHNDSHEADESH